MTRKVCAMLEFFLCGNGKNARCIDHSKQILRRMCFCVSIPHFQSEMGNLIIAQAGIAPE